MSLDRPPTATSSTRTAHGALAPPPYGMGTPLGYNASDQREDSPPFKDLESFYDIRQEDGSLVRPEIHCQIQKGFFKASDGVWTCYRRNYFSVNCAYSLRPPAESQRLYLSRREDHPHFSTSEQIQSIAMTISATVEGTSGTAVGLVQHTPKRDKGPQLEVQLIELLPTPTTPDTSLGLASHNSSIDIGKSGYSLPPHLPLQSGPQFTSAIPTKKEGHAPSPPPTEVTHTFERIQFKSATANNGKRRAQQQYYVLQVELWVNIRSSAAHHPTWLKVAQRCSSQLIIRGRSPYHYANEGPHMSGISGETSYRNSTPLWRLVTTGPGYRLPSNEATSGFSPNQLQARHITQLSTQEKVDNQPAAEQPSEAVVLDDSSVSSVQSLGTGSRRTASRSSFTSFQLGPSVAEQFAALILESREIKTLSETCFSLDDENRTERNVRRLLRILAAGLRSEATNPADMIMARALRRYVRQIASLMRSQCAHDYSPNPQLPLNQVPTSKGFMMNQFLSECLPHPDEPTETRVSIIKSDSEEPVRRRVLNNNEQGKSGKAEALPSIVPEPNDRTSDKDDSDDERSDVDLFEGRYDPLNLDLEGRKEFFRGSEALADFHEGLIDFQVAMENARHNQVLAMHEKSNNLGHNRWIIPPSIPDLWAWIFGKLRKRLRPVLRSGFRRIEWKCDCGKELYADFSNDDPIAIDKLESALQQTFSPLGSNGFLNPVNGNAPDVPPGNTRGELGPSPVAPQSDSRQASTGGLPIAANSILNVQHDQVSPQRKYFAICISAGGIYKVLTEIDVSSLKSDAGLFLAVKEIYQNSRKSKIRWRMFLEPVNIEFVQFSLWNTRQGYVSICDRPTCVPPKDDFQYAFSPRPLQPLPPVPPEIFMHYLEHGEHDMNPNMYVWTPRLPKRKDSRIIDCPLPTFGWGIYIREGPNRVFVFWMIMVTVVCSVILCILWTSVKGDIQGGSGLGTLILALPSVIMAAFMFKFSDTY